MITLSKILLHPRTKRQADAFSRSPSHALLILAPPGSGKTALARNISTELLGLSSDNNLQDYPYFTHIKRPVGKQDISIDTIRDLKKLLRLKVPGTREVRRVILIEDAHDLNEEAQNAMLKMLEEPASDCVFILTCLSVKSLLPTIVSRTQQLQVHSISISQAKESLGGEYSENEIDNAWLLSGGAAGLLMALLEGDKSHPLRQAIEDAKLYLRGDKYQRLLISDSLSKDKIQLRLFLEALLKLLAALHYSALQKNSFAQQSRLLASRKLVNKLLFMLDENVSAKVIALMLALDLL